MTLDKNKLKIIATVLVIACLIGAFCATMYLRVRLRSEVSIKYYEMGIQYMAMDRNITGDYVLQNDSYAYRLNLSTWGTTTAKTYPAAFAIVNPADRALIISKIEVKGTTSPLRIYLHKNATLPCDPDAFHDDQGINFEDGATDMQLYYDGTTSIDWGNNGWRLGAGLGYNDTGALMYTDDGTEYNAINATWNSTLGVWTYNSTPLAGTNKANNLTANFVWVEIDLIVPGTAETAEYEDEILIHVEVSTAPDEGPMIDFMACDRIGGGYVMYGYTNRSVKFNLDSWRAGANRSFPGAFAIVNTESTTVRVQKIEVTGDTNGYLRVYLHANHTLPCNASIIAPDLDDDDDRQLYYDGSSSINWGDNGWRLGAGPGYNQVTKELIYSKDGTEADAINATRVSGFPDSKYYMWVYNETATMASHFANNLSANFVWVEIDIIVPSDAAEASYSGELQFYFKSA